MDSLAEEDQAVEAQAEEHSGGFPTWIVLFSAAVVMLGIGTTLVVRTNRMQEEQVEQVRKAQARMEVVPAGY